MILEVLTLHADNNDLMGINECTMTLDFPAWDEFVFCCFFSFMMGGGMDTRL